MNKTKHTPGNWHVNKSMPGWGGVCISRRPESDYWNDGHVNIIGDAPIAQVIKGDPIWENTYPFEANAKLIAAAPELLEACMEMVKHLEETDFDVCGTPDEMIKRWKAAIKKATK